MISWWMSFRPVQRVSIKRRTKIEVIKFNWTLMGQNDEIIYSLPLSESYKVYWNSSPLYPTQVVTSGLSLLYHTCLLMIGISPFWICLSIKDCFRFLLWPSKKMNMIIFTVFSMRVVKQSFFKTIWVNHSFYLIL